MPLFSVYKITNFRDFCRKLWLILIKITKSFISFLNVHRVLLSHLRYHSSVCSLSEHEINAKDTPSPMVIVGNGERMVHVFQHQDLTPLANISHQIHIHNLLLSPSAGDLLLVTPSLNTTQHVQQLQITRSIIGSSLRVKLINLESPLKPFSMTLSRTPTQPRFLCDKFASCSKVDISFSCKIFTKRISMLFFILVRSHWWRLIIFSLMRRWDSLGSALDFLNQREISSKNLICLKMALFSV